MTQEYIELAKETLETYFKMMSDPHYSLAEVRSLAHKIHNTQKSSGVCWNKLSFTKKEVYENERAAAVRETERCFAQLSLPLPQQIVKKKMCDIEKLISHYQIQEEVSFAPGDIQKKRKGAAKRQAMDLCRKIENTPHLGNAQEAFAEVRRLTYKAGMSWNELPLPASEAAARIQEKAIPEVEELIDRAINSKNKKRAKRYVKRIRHILNKKYITRQEVRLGDTRLEDLLNMIEKNEESGTADKPTLSDFEHSFA